MFGRVALRVLRFQIGSRARLDHPYWHTVYSSQIKTFDPPLEFSSSANRTKDLIVSCKSTRENEKDKIEKKKRGKKKETRTRLVVK